MSKINDGGYVFPSPALADPSFSAPFDLNGMTLRQHYAGLAMKGLLSANSIYGGKSDDRGALARDAIAHADALIAELEKNGPAPSDIATGEIG